MLNPIEIAYQSGMTLYAVIHNKDGTVWNGSAWEAYNPSHWTTYAVALSEQAQSGYYSAAAPAGIGTSLTTECVYNQQGGSPAIADALAGPISIGASQGVDVAAVEHVEQAAVNMQLNLSQLVPGSVTTGAISATQVPTNLTNALSGIYVNRLIIFTSGTCAQEAALITGYSGATKLLTFTAIAGTPSPGDGFIIV
jgi:hypothetical protein